MGSTPGGEDRPLKGIERTLKRVWRHPSRGQRSSAHSSGWGCQIVMFAWEVSSWEWATGLQWAAETAPRTSAGFSRAGPLTELRASIPWFAWLPAGSGRSGEKQKGGGMASCGPTRPCPSKNKFGNECCFLRRRHQPLACWRFPIFPEPFVGGASTRLRGHCSEITCLLPGSVFPAHALLSASVNWAEPTLRGTLLE